MAALQGPGQAVLMEQLRNLLAQAAHKLQSSQSQQALLALLGSLAGPAALRWGSQTGAAGLPPQAVLQQLLLRHWSELPGMLAARGELPSSQPQAARPSRQLRMTGLPCHSCWKPLHRCWASATSSLVRQQAALLPGLAGQQALGLLLLQLPVERLLIPLAQLAGARHHYYSKPPSGSGCHLHLPSPEEQSHARRLLEASAEALQAAVASAGTPAQQQRQAALAALHRGSRVLPWAAALPLAPLLACQWPQSGQVPNSASGRGEQQAVPPSQATAQACKLPRRQLQRVTSARTLPVLLTADLQQLLAPPSFLRLTPVFRQCLLRELASAQAHGYPAVAGRVPDTTVHPVSAVCDIHTKGWSLRQTEDRQCLLQVAASAGADCFLCRVTHQPVCCCRASQTPALSDPGCSAA